MGLEPLLILAGRGLAWVLPLSRCGTAAMACPETARSGVWKSGRQPWTALFRGWKEAHPGKARSVNLGPKAGTLLPSTTAVWTISGNLPNRSPPASSQPCRACPALHLAWMDAMDGGVVVELGR
jgi:hypothetical protein